MCYNISKFFSYNKYALLSLSNERFLFWANKKLSIESKIIDSTIHIVYYTKKNHLLQGGL